jgi:WXG100 family type VII secretion target
MALIKIDPDSLNTRAADVGAKIDELNSLNARLQQLIERIGSSWEGDASAKFIAMMLGYSKQAMNMVNILQEFKKYAESAAAEFSGEDRTSADRIRGSF